MDYDQILHDSHSRRAFLHAAGVTVTSGSAVFLAACGRGRASSASATTGAAPRAADVAILNNAIDLEHRAIAAYTAAIPLLSSTTQKAAKQFLLQEFAHASALSSLIKGDGGKPRPVAPSYNLGRPRDVADVLTLLHMIERAAITAYVDAIPKLSPGTLRARIASILANEAQHIALVRQALGQPPVPEALVTGSA
jgi:rubrerythrin